MEVTLEAKSLRFVGVSGSGFNLILMEVTLEEDAEFIILIFFALVSILILMEVTLEGVYSVVP